VVPAGVPAARIAAAYHQHLVAVATLEALAARGEDHQQLAARLGQQPDRVRRKLHGEVPMSLEDVMAYVLDAGIQILPEINGPDDLLPAGARHQSRTGVASGR